MINVQSVFTDHISLLTMENGTSLIVTPENTFVYFHVTFLIVLATLGIVGNLLVTFIYTKRIDLVRKSERYLLLALAIVDFFGCIFQGLHHIVMRYYRDKITSSICSFFTFIVYFIVASSATLFLCIAILRYQKICRPFGRQATIKWYRLCLLISLGAGFGYAVPKCLLKLHSYRKIRYTKTDSNGNATVTSYNLCDFDKYDLRNAAWESIGMVLIILLSIVTVCLYIPVIHRTRQLFQKSKFNVEGTDKQTLPEETGHEETRRREENTLKRLNRLCFVMALVNSISYVPYCVIGFLSLSKTISNPTMDEIKALTFFTSIPLFQHAVNPYVNIAFDLKVRTEIRMLCLVRRCCKNNESNDHTDQPSKTQDNSL